MFEQVCADLQRLYGVRAAQLACDAHPDFPNSRWARTTGLPVIPVQHHHAHASALAGEFDVSEPMLCFTWDGVGFGERGQLWGGEAFHGLPGHWQRVASFRPFRLPGGDRAAREPWRTAVALCWAAGRSWAGADAETLHKVQHMLGMDVACPATTAVGRLFDAASALAGVCREASFEGEAPMRLESLCAAHDAPARPLRLVRDERGLWRSDWAALVDLMLDASLPVAERAAGFHAAMARALVDQARAVRVEREFSVVGLTGGVFQNRTLTALAMSGLRDAGFEVLMPGQLPVNDAGISYGQVIDALARSEA